MAELLDHYLCEVRNLKRASVIFCPLVGSHTALAQSLRTAANAEVAKRQTQWTQNPPSERTCGFKSRPRHQMSPLRRGIRDFAE
jgi:hypothetical protein